MSCAILEFEKKKISVS